MALPSNIPTSFAPRSAPPPQRFQMSFLSVFSILCYFLLILSFVGASGVFFYDRLLAATLASKESELQKAEAAIDSSEAQGFIQLHDRLDTSATLLANHIAPSGLFDLLEASLPSTVTLTTLTLSLDDHASTLSAMGVARTFNALAAASASLGAKGMIKDAVFSHLTVNKDNSVSFSLSAILDRKLITYTATATPQLSAPKATLSASTTSPL